MNQEPNLGKNYWIALVLSLVVLMGYPAFLKWMNPPPPQDLAGIQDERVEADTRNQQEIPAYETTKLSEPEGPFLEKPAKPSLVLYENHFLKAELSTLGGTITNLFYKGEEHDAEGHTRSFFFEGNPDHAGILGISLTNEKAQLRQTIFKLTRRGSAQEQFEFHYEKPGEYRLTKTFTFEENQPVIMLDILIENLSGQEKHFPIEFRYGLQYFLEHAHDSRFVSGVVKGEKIKTGSEGKIKKKGFDYFEPSEWSGIIKKYFAILAKPDWKTLSVQFRAPSESVIEATVKLEPITLSSSARRNQKIAVYVGPQRHQALKETGFGFEELSSRGFFGFFKLILLMALNFFHGFTHNYGWDIILVTLIIKGLFTPLTHMSFDSMKKMQVLQPKLKNLQERYKKDPTKLNQEMMAIYKRNKVNPMMGCLPMLLQIPIFIAFYQGLSEAIELKGAPFIFWIQDLSEPDRLLTLPFVLPILGNGLNILPLLMTGSMVLQQKLTPTAAATPEQTKMMALMPLIFGVMFYAMPSGLVLYWFVNNCLSIIHQGFIKRIAFVLHDEDKE